MELKRECNCQGLLGKAFNRTSMELKLFSGIQTAPSQGAFNRTSMELKHWMSPVVIAAVSAAAFNRTSVELKHVIVGYFNDPNYTFNRTSMELKPNTITPNASITLSF